MSKRRISERAHRLTATLAVRCRPFFLPKGGGTICGIGEKFSANPVTGTASLSVPVFTTPSRSDFYPNSISRKATELEHARDEKSREAAVLLSQHETYAAAVALLQIAIALGAIAALTRYRLVWYGSVGLGIVAAILLAIPFFGG
jgi:Domain of unknown function (DUF4337)